jgi:hypothetical protein
MAVTIIDDADAGFSTTGGGWTNTGAGGGHGGDFSSDVASARNLRGWVLWTNGSSLVQTFPDDGHIPIEIQAVGN